MTRERERTMTAKRKRKISAVGKGGRRGGREERKGK
jgi:hypothetical protein